MCFKKFPMAAVVILDELFCAAGDNGYTAG
jgi:hypothetical protein